MFYDYVEIEKYLSPKDTFEIGLLKERFRTPNGLIKFHYNIGFNSLDVSFNEHTKYFNIKGSFPFAFQGHNFFFLNSTFYEGIENVEEALKINLLDSDLKAFEFGTIIKVDIAPKEILNKHIAFKGFKRTEYERGVYFEDKILKLKLYDAGYRIKTACKPLLNTLRKDCGFKSIEYYIRVENHYKKPQIHFKNRHLKLENLFSESFQELCRNDLIKTYKSISKMKPSIMPNDKKLLSTSTIPLLYLKEVSSRYGFDAEEGLLEYLKSIPKEILPINDRKQRKRQLKDNFSKLSTCEGVPLEYDLTEKLEKTFY